MRRLWLAWVALWSRQEAATPMVLVRIFLGLAITVDLLQIGLLDLVSAVWAPPPDGLGYGARAGLWSVDWLGASAHTAHVLYAVLLGAAICVTLGLFTRVSAVVFVLVSAQLGRWAPDCDRGIDMAFRMGLLILAVSSCHARWSLDALLRKKIFKRPFPELVAAWPRYLLFVQLLWIYFSGGHNKGGAEWWPRGGFHALGNVMSDPHVARFHADWVPTIFPLLQVMTVATMTFELGAPSMILWTWLSRRREARLARLGRVLRFTWLTLGLGFHLGIALFMNLGIFPFGMLAFYPCLFSPDELHALARRFIRRRAAGET